MATETKTEGKREIKTGKNALEWTVFGLSLMLITATFGWLIYESLRRGNTPPRLEITLGEPIKAGKRMLVPVSVENRGDTTAQGVEIEIERPLGNGKPPETAHFSLPHLPRGGKRQGWVAFDAPVDKSQLSAKILGYEES